MMNVYQSTDMAPGDAVIMALSVLQTDPGWSTRSVASFNKWIVAPILMGQMIIAKVEDEPVAIMTWATIDPTETDNAISGKDWDVQDWDSGNLMWLMDLVAKPGHGTEFLHMLRDVSKTTGMAACWWRGRHGRVGSCGPLEALV